MFSTRRRGADFSNKAQDGTERRIEVNKNRAVRKSEEVSGQETTIGEHKRAGGKGGEATKRGSGATDGGGMIGHVTVIRVKGREDALVQRGLDRNTCDYNAPEYENGTSPIPGVFRSLRGSQRRSTIDMEDTQQETAEHSHCSTGGQINFGKGKHEWLLRTVRSIGRKNVRTMGQEQGGQRATLGGRWVLQ